MVAYVCGCHCPVGCVGHLICAHFRGGHTVVVVVAVMVVAVWSYTGIDGRREKPVNNVLSFVSKIVLIF